MERLVIVVVLLMSGGCAANRSPAVVVAVPLYVAAMFYERALADADRLAERASSDDPIAISADYYQPVYVERPSLRHGEPYCVDDVPVCVRDREVTRDARVVCAWDGTPRCAGPRVACPHDSFAYCAAP